MKILLDTHTAIWSVAKSGKLSSEADELIGNTDNEIFYSIISVWEIAIKHKKHPKQMPMSEEGFVALCNEVGFMLLPLTLEHIYKIKTLERAEDAPRHEDPFDRLLIAQAKSEGIKFLTRDVTLSHYDETCIFLT